MLITAVLAFSCLIVVFICVCSQSVILLLTGLKPVIE